jgi:hypothetical protein
MNKIPFYNIVNILLTGLIFTGILIIFYYQEISAKIYINNISITFVSIYTFAFFAIIYEIGLIINRLGSLLEDLLRYFKLIPFNDNYKKFNETKQKFPILEILSREYALSRTSMTLFLLISILTFIKFQFYGFIPITICLLFFYSCRKYSKKIIKLME